MSQISRSAQGDIKMQCPICLEDIATLVDSPEGLAGADCVRCGHFYYDAPVEQALKKETKHKRALIASWVWEQNRNGAIPRMAKADLPSLLSMRPLPFMEKTKRLLIHYTDQSGQYWQKIEWNGPKVCSMLATFDQNDVIFVLDFLRENGWVKQKEGSNDNYVTSNGFLKAEEWKQSAVESAQGFVAMWINKETDDAWSRGLMKGVVDAGYKALRIDKKEHANKICDEIISEIRRSRFLVADYTGHRGGVYYEAGFAAGRGIPVILTCEKNQMDDLHFDIRQYNCIDWQTPEELAARLKVRIEAVIGDGPLKKHVRGQARK